MQTLTVEILHTSAFKMLQELQEKHLIKILPQQPYTQSFDFPDEPFTVQEMKEWVKNREKGISMSLQTAKNQWANKEKQFFTKNNK